jgi:small-conductance mechanosensitive channel
MNWPTPLALLLQAGPLPSLFEYWDAPRLSSVLLLVLATWLVMRYATKLLEFFSELSPRDRFLLKLAQPVIGVTLWTAALFVSFGILAPSREAFLAGVASVGLALGLGAQDLAKNFFSGIVMLVTRPFQMGDRVRIGGSYGEIDYIGLLSTKLTKPDDTRVTFPNSMVVSSQVFNANSGVPDCQVVTDLDLPPATDPQEAMRIGYEAAHTCPYLLSSQTGGRAPQRRHRTATIPVAAHQGVRGGPPLRAENAERHHAAGEGGISGAGDAGCVEVKGRKRAP